MTDVNKFLCDWYDTRDDDDEHAQRDRVGPAAPLALDVAVRDGRVKKDDLIVLEAMGGGFTWGAAVVRF